MEWTRGTPFDPTTYAKVLPSCDALVSTLGILLEDDYKRAGQAQPLSVLRSIAGNLVGETRNPLRERRGDRTYERMNRDSGERELLPALEGDERGSSFRSCCLSWSSVSLVPPKPTVIEAFRAFRQSRTVPSCNATTPSLSRSPFVFISAEDVFRPFVPARYIESKRQAEQTILAEARVEAGERQIRPVFVRPSAYSFLNRPSPRTLLH